MMSSNMHTRSNGDTIFNARSTSLDNCVLSPGNGFNTPPRLIHSPSFSIYLSNKQRKPGLIKAFIETHHVDVNARTIRLADDSLWPLYRDKQFVSYLLNTTESIGWLKCLVSFQCFNDGTYFAVARPYKEKEKDTKHV